MSKKADKMKIKIFFIFQNLVRGFTKFFFFFFYIVHFLMKTSFVQQGIDATQEDILMTSDSNCYTQLLLVLSWTLTEY